MKDVGGSSGSDRPSPSFRDTWYDAREAAEFRLLWLPEILAALLKEKYLPA